MYCLWPPHPTTTTRVLFVATPLLQIGSTRVLFVATPLLQIGSTHVLFVAPHYNVLHQ